MKKAASAETMSASSRLPHIATMPGLARAFRIWASNASTAQLPDVPGADEDERHLLACLGGVAAALAGERVGAWPTPVCSWALAAPRPPEELMEAVREGLGRRVDPLAVLYDACISAANRRRLGTVFTPTPVVNHMIGLTGKYLDRAPAVIVDPGAGVGVFSIAAARRWPNSRVLAVDVNVVTLGLLGARVAFEIDADPQHAQALERIELILGDYLDELDHLYANAPTGTVAVIGNPPYTRIQELPAEERRRIVAACSGISLSGHANLAMLFQAATISRMRAVDVSCMVLPGSFIYTQASRGLRHALWYSHRSVEVQRWPATTSAFAGRSVQAAVLMLGPERSRRRPLALARVEVDGPSVKVIESWRLSRTDSEPDNWFWIPENKSAHDTVALIEITKVRRGVATGANDVFFVPDAVAATLPSDVLTRAIVTLRRFVGDELDEQRHTKLGDAGEPRWLLAVPSGYEPTGALRAYLEAHMDVARRYLPAQRPVWYAVTNLLRPQLLFSPLSSADFRIVLNTVRAVPSNNLFGITLLNGGDPSRLVAWLRSGQGQKELRRVSRRYHGGSHKLEPGDLGRVRVPTAIAASLASEA